MKRALKKIILIALMLSMSVTVLSCSSDTKTYTESGLVFTLPKDMKKLTVTYADVCFGNDDKVEFFIYFYTRDMLLTELYLDKDCSVQQYSEDFLAQYTSLGIEIETDLNVEVGYITHAYVYEDEDENDFYFDYIIRDYNMLYHVTMCCDVSLKETYKPIFDEWIRDIKISR